MRYKTLNIILIMTGVLVFASSIASVYLMNERRDDALHQAAALEAQSRYETSLAACERGNLLRKRINQIVDGSILTQIPLVFCDEVIPPPYVR